MTLPNIIAIDGPAASGKTTLGLRLAERLGYLFFDTGVMYRALTWAVLNRSIHPQNESAVTSLVKNIQIDVRPPSQPDGRTSDVWIEQTSEQGEVLRPGTVGSHSNVAGESSTLSTDVTWEIRRPDVEGKVSMVSAYPGVRKELAAQQRRIGLRGRLVMVGRDIGTVVLPEADLKIYLDASVEKRAMRRYTELQDRGQPVQYDEILEALRRRDQIDSTRAVAPLKPAEDALILNSDLLNADEVLDQVLLIIEKFPDITR